MTQAETDNVVEGLEAIKVVYRNKYRNDSDSTTVNRIYFKK